MADRLVSSVWNKLDSLISEEVGRFWGAKTELNKLKSELQAISATIKAADGLPYFMVEGVKDWLQKLKDVAYDAEDIIDEYQARIDMAMDECRRPKKVRGLVPDVPFLFNKYRLGYNLGKEIAAVNGRLAQVSKEKQRYSFHGFAAKIKEVNTNRQTNYFLNEKEVVGRESDKKALIEKLMLDDQSCSGVSILSIVGIGGVGKTTLAKMVFNDERVKKHFGESMWWVFVSQRPSAEDVNKKILEAVKKEGVSISELNTMCELLSPLLSKQKFLLVLDDVWDLDWWEQLKALLRTGASGSRILITTRIVDISREMRAMYMHEVESFTFNESWDLFLQNALRDGETEEVLERLNLKDIAYNIVNKCGGLPLVVQTVGSVMHSKERKRDDWKFVSDSKIWDWKLPSSSQGSSLLPGLILSYDELPSMLKPYFAYFSLLEKGHSMSKKDFILEAMAHGYVNDANGIDMEVNASQQINDLLGRCLIQVEKPKEQIWLKMHDILHDLATHVAGREYCREHTSVDKYTRHLAISDCLVSLDELWLQSAESLRTLLYCGCLSESSLDNIFKNLKRLRVLDLSYSTFSKLPVSVGDLILLKCLGLQHSNIEELPGSIGKLYNLQTLRLGGSKIKRLPKEIGELCNLRHLDLKDTSKLEFVPEGLGKLSCLRELTRFLICDGSGSDAAGSNIRELKNLKNLHGKLAIQYLERVKEKNDAIVAELQQKHFVEELELAYGRIMVDQVSSQEELKNVAEAHESLFEELLLPPNLNHLTVTQYCGRLIPVNWCSHGNQMRIKSVELQRCPCVEMLPNSSILICLHLFECHHLRELPSFPSLLELVIDQCDGLNQLPIFSKLETLKLEKLVNWEGWQPRMEERAMRSLTTLRLSNCPKLRKLPRFPSLKQLDVINCKALCTIQEAKGDVKPDPEMSALTDLVVCGCQELCELPSMPILKTLKMEDCHKIKHIPPLRRLEKLEVLNCQDWEGWTFGIEKDAMSCLEAVTITSCPLLKSLPDAPALKFLHVWCCEELNALWDDKQPPVELEALGVADCPQLGFSLDAMLPLAKLQTLGLSWFPECAQATPSHLAYLQSLPLLVLKCLPGQNPLPEWLWQLSSLKALALSNLTDARSLQSKWQNLKQLESLYIRKCPELSTFDRFLTEPQKQDDEALDQQITQLSVPPKLELLEIRDCPRLASLPSCLQHMGQLKYLTLKRLRELRSLPQGITNLHKLEVLEIEDCPKISSLPVDMKSWLGWRLIIKGCPAVEG